MRTQLNETGIASRASSFSSSSSSSSSFSFALPLPADSRVSENLIYMHTHDAAYPESDMFGNTFDDMDANKTCNDEDAASFELGFIRALDVE